MPLKQNAGIKWIVRVVAINLERYRYTHIYTHYILKVVFVVHLKVILYILPEVKVLKFGKHC